MKRTAMATALRIHCAERTRATQLVCVCASILAPYFSHNVCVWKDMRCKYESKITIIKDGKSAEATKLMAVMGLGVKCGQTVTVTVEGADEEAAFENMKAFFEANL